MSYVISKSNVTLLDKVSVTPTIREKVQPLSYRILLYCVYLLSSLV